MTYQSQPNLLWSWTYKQFLKEIKFMNIDWDTKVNGGMINFIFTTTTWLSEDFDEGFSGILNCLNFSQKFGYFLFKLSGSTDFIYLLMFSLVCWNAEKKLKSALEIRRLFCWRDEKEAVTHIFVLRLQLFAEKLVTIEGNLKFPFFEVNKFNLRVVFHEIRIGPFQIVFFLCRSS